MDQTEIAQKRMGYLRSEFYYEAPRFTKAISREMKEFVLARIDFVLDEYLSLGQFVVSNSIEQPYYVEGSQDV